MITPRLPTANRLIVKERVDLVKYFFVSRNIYKYNHKTTAENKESIRIPLLQLLYLHLALILLIRAY